MNKENFYKRFQMNVRDDHFKLRRIRRESQINPWSVTFSDAMTYSESSLQVEEVDTVSVRMPKDQLELIQRMFEHYENNEIKIKSQHEVLAIYREHERIRMSNPIVAKAYEKYIMLLELVRNDTSTSRT